MPMDAAKQGKFCNACQKTVIDFTLMSDNELAAFFKKSDENVCGRFANEQLNTDLQIPAKKIPWLKYFFQITIPAFLLSFKASAQTNTLKGKVAYVENKKPSKNAEVKSDTGRIVIGRAIDDNGNPVRFASVRIKETRNGTATDSAGHFKITLPASHSVLVFTAVGFDAQELDFKNITSREITLKLWEGALGEVIVIAPKRKASLIEPSKSFTIFPNPVSNCSKLNIKWQNKIASDQSVEIFNEAGNLLQQQQVKVERKTNQQSVDLKSLSAGTYIIKITDNKTQRSSSQQFVVL